MNVKEIKIDKYSNIVYWIASTGIASVVIMSYVHSFVFTRTEATNLETRINSIENDQKQQIDKLDRKLDKIYDLLMNRK